jgi:spermidine/putrescine transport system substrate-binding protein
MLAAGALAASTSLAGAQDAGQLNIYNWGNYTSPEMIEKFEEETGIEVTVTDFDSNDTALTRIRAGGHGFDIVVPSNNYVPIWVEAGLLAELDPAEIPNHANIAERWMNVDWDPGRKHTVPWQWGTTGVIVNTSVYDGDINTSGIFLDPPDELKGKINVIPEMTDVMNLAVRYVGGEQCSTDRDILRQARDKLTEAKQHWIALDYGTVDAYAAGDIAAGVYWNGASMRARLQNEDLAYGYPKEGYPVWMDSAAILADAQNPENAKTFLNFVLEPENAAMISEFARYANGVEGSEEFMPEDMKTAPEIVVAAEHEPAGYFSVTCPAETQQIYTQIWTELLR